MTLTKHANTRFFLEQTKRFGLEKLMFDTLKSTTANWKIYIKKKKTQTNNFFVPRTKLAHWLLLFHFISSLVLIERRV